MLRLRSLDLAVPGTVRGVSANQELEQVRREIDRVDRDVVRLLAARELLVRRAGHLKTDVQQVPAPQRVEHVITRVREAAAQAGASPDVVERTYRAMIAAFIDLELDAHTTLGAVTTPRAP